MAKRAEHQATGHHDDLYADEHHQPGERLVHEAVRMQPDAEHVRPEEGPRGDGVAKDRHGDESALADYPTPARVQDGGVPDDNHQRAVFLRIPSPETAPRLIGPNAAKHRADETEQRRKTDDAIDHLGEG